ncbi:TerC family protein [Propionibacteriaceae bacterium Y2011]|uniref:TerC family protein n=1 Tax=Microlunatus sp. Y2014 TaxID=3418488 RepID=UPI003B4EA746
MNVHLYAWAITVVVLLAILAIDVFVIGRRPHEPSMKEAGLFIGLYVALAVIFGIGVGIFSGWQFGGEFFAGWLTEYSLSIDNLFIFIIIMAKMKVPRHLQQFALMVGIIIALVFRAVFIAVGAAAIDRFAGVFFLFGAILIYTAVKIFQEWLAGDEQEDTGENVVMRWVRKRFKSTDGYRGVKLRVKENGQTLVTPMLFVIIALGTTDLMFALDSIPAIYGLTQEPYLVLTANVFALMGLRQLYFLIGGLLQRLVYLQVGLSVILVFIGVKLFLHALHETHLLEFFGLHVDIPEIPIWMSLGVIIVTLAVTTVASLIKTGRDRKQGVGGSDEPEGYVTPAGDLSMVQPKEASDVDTAGGDVTAGLTSSTEDKEGQ